MGSWKKSMGPWREVPGSDNPFTSVRALRAGIGAFMASLDWGTGGAATALERGLDLLSLKGDVGLVKDCAKTSNAPFRNFDPMIYWNGFSDEARVRRQWEIDKHSPLPQFPKMINCLPGFEREYEAFRWASAEYVLRRTWAKKRAAEEEKGAREAEG